MRKKAVAYFGMFLALALILSYVESLVPIALGIPGVKLGLANLITVMVLYRIGAKEAFLLSLLRVTIAGFLFGNLFAILYSMAGACASLAVMVLLKKVGTFSIIGVSIAGGVFHNIGQLIVAMLVLQSASLVYYFAVLMIAGLVTGFVIGVLSLEVTKRLRLDLRKD